VITSPRKSALRDGGEQRLEIHKQLRKVPFRPRAQEVEVGTNLICDTQEQVERFVAL
jgi:hypothetical protein